MILIAEDQGYFNGNGLHATVKAYDIALATLDGMKLDEVDVAESAEFPIVREVFKRDNISIIACIDRFQNVWQQSGLFTSSLYRLISRFLLP